eukprot:Pgem_evm1s7636
MAVRNGQRNLFYWTTYQQQSITNRICYKKTRIRGKMDYLIAQSVATTNSRISNEQWSLRDRRIDTYRPLGCSALAHDPREKKPKSNDRANECIIMSTPLDSTDDEYLLLLHLKTKQTIRSRSVLIFLTLYPMTYAKNNRN